MSLVPSLLQAIVQIDGEALVMHAGDKPYVVSPTGQVDLASRGLTLEAVNGIISQLLPPEVLEALDEFGAAQYQLPTRPDFPQEQFTIVAARGGDDIWAEIRRRRILEEDQIPEELFGPAATQGTGRQDVAALTASAPMASAAKFAAQIDEDDTPAFAPPLTAHIDRVDRDAAMIAAVDDAVNFEEIASGPIAAKPPDADAFAIRDEALDIPHVDSLFARRPETTEAPATIDQDNDAIDIGDFEEQPAAALPPPKPAPPAREVHPPPRIEPPAPQLVTPPPPQPAVVLPMSRSPIRPEPPGVVTGQSGTGLDRLLRLAAARGASTLYLSTDARPSVRVDGENQALEGEPVLSAYDVESLLLPLMPERSHEALRTGAATEWINDFDDIGRVRCMSVSDHRGPGGVFRLMPMRAVSMEQLALSREIQSLAIEPEGLVLVAGPRSSGKRTLISAFIDLINRTRRDHVISIESEINVVHERGTAFVSQREVRGSSEDVHAAARAALREDPDVLVIEDLKTGVLMNVALEAAASGHLVIGGFSAHSATAAIDRIIDLYAPEYRRQIQMALAEQVRGVVAQVLLRRQGGGRVAARELLLNTPAVASVIAEGKTSQLPMAIEGGRRHGMVPLNDGLVGFVQSGTVDVRDAYRRSPDRGAFLSLLKRQGIDTSALERPA